MSTEESAAEEASESPEEKEREFADSFTLRGVTRLVEYSLVAVRILFNKDPQRREYEYYIPYSDYEYDKLIIAREILRQQRKPRA